MKDDLPVVSILIPIYNVTEYGFGYLEKLCESIKAQTFTNYEVIFGDDASSDNTLELLEPYLRDQRFKLIKWNKNKGLHYNIFYLLNVARGIYWCPPGQDDILDPTFLEERVKLLESNPQAVLVHGSAKWINESGDLYINETINHGLKQLEERIPIHMSGDRLLNSLLQHNFINWPSTLVRLDITKLVLPFFVPYYKYAMDWSLWILLASTGYDFIWDRKSLISYRMHDNSISGSISKKNIRKIERKIVPLSSLQAASQFSNIAKSVWSTEKLRLYRWWIATAIDLYFKKLLEKKDLNIASQAFYGSSLIRYNFHIDLFKYGFSSFIQYVNEKRISKKQIFKVSGLSLIDDPLFR